MIKLKERGCPQGSADGSAVVCNRDSKSQATARRRAEQKSLHHTKPAVTLRFPCMPCSCVSVTAKYSLPAPSTLPVQDFCVCSHKLIF